MVTTAEPMLSYPLTGFALTLILTPLAIKYAKHQNLLDYPGQRRSHQQIIPRGGGVAAVIVLLALCGLLIYQQLIPLTVGLGFTQAVLLLGMVGFLDDHTQLSNRYRLLAQALACGLAIYLFWPLSLSEWQYWLWVPAFLAMIWLTNLYNFMDGSHGMAAAEGIFAGLLLAWLLLRAGAEELALLAALLAAVSAGFMPWNFPKPKVFMGDVLSGVLGVSFAVLLLIAWTNYQINPILLSLVLASFVVDATLTLMVRIFTGQQWYTAHKEHVYQQLVSAANGHVGTWFIYQALNCLIILPAVWLAETGRISVFWAAVFVYLLFSSGWYAIYRLQVKNKKRQ